MVEVAGKGGVDEARGNQVAAERGAGPGEEDREGAAEGEAGDGGQRFESDTRAAGRDCQLSIEVYGCYDVFFEDSYALCRLDLR